MTHGIEEDAWQSRNGKGRLLTVDPIPEPILPSPEQVDALIKNVQSRGAIVRIELPDGSVKEIFVPPIPKQKQGPHPRDHI
jgi:hypothetical protein